MIRAAVLGAGWVANARYLPVLRRLKGIEIVSVFDRNQERAAQAAKAFGVPHSSDDLDAVFDQHPDVVFICTSPWSHSDLAVRAFESGCHVLTEKPMAMDSAEADLMAQAARSSGRLLCVSHNFLFSRAVRKADRALQRTGTPLYVVGNQLSSDRRRLPTWHEQLPGGLLFDEIPHLLYIAQHYLGALQLEAVRVARKKGITITELQLQGEHGPGHITVTSGAPVSEWHVTLIAPEGVVDLDLFRDIAVRIPSDGPHRAADILKTSARAVLGHLGGFVGSGTRLAGKRLFWGHDVLIARFLDAVATGGRSPVTIDDAVGVVALTDDILAALDAH